VKSKIILLLAIVMGLITTVLFYNYISNINNAPNPNVEMIDTLVAIREIKKNELISTDMIKSIQVVKGGLYGNAISTSSEVVGKYAAADIAEGEPFLAHRLWSAQDEKLFVSRKIKEGSRGVSIGVNFVQSVSNLIEPEDHVDVIFTKLGKPELGTETESRILLDKVRVLAIGRKMIETVEGELYVEYSSATLELNANETVQLVNASNEGIITLTLHSRIVQNNGKKTEEGNGNVK
jgi:pilus assembly protein CpaB